MNNIIQWNCRDLRANFNFIDYYVTTTSCTCVERSNIKPVHEHVVQKLHTYIIHERPTVYLYVHIQCKIM